MKALLAVLVVATVACSTRDAPTPATTTSAAVERPDQTIGGTVVPQIHDFPAGHAADIRRIFDGSALSYPISVISDKGVQTQFVNPRPVFVSDRRFVVGLPPASHAALDKLIAGLSTAPTPLGATYEITFWAVEGSSAAQPDVPADLAEIAPVLDKLAALGKRRFKSLDRVGGRTRDGAQTKLVGRLLKAEHRPIAGPDGIELEVTLQLIEDKATPTIETTLHLPLDQPLVIGDSAQSTATDGNANLLLYVVRAHRVE
jgi:hypothetical protein